MKLVYRILLRDAVYSRGNYKNTIMVTSKNPYEKEEKSDIIRK